ncbi:hypothetical protein [Peribacillus butanolivorans]|uniref:hypothetical protein n=1 Tax=Peribacillus butanolivorans TaxID=421767 RepID=UPI0036D7EA1F
MTGSLLIAEYNGKLIELSEYQKSLHWGNLHCPFCDPKIKVNYIVKGYFAAWPGTDGHNCGRGQAKYFDADWKGQKITEISRNNGNIEVLVDIQILINKETSRINNTKNHSKNEPKHSFFPNYKERKEVFRDVIRSVLQMKKMLEKNTINQLNNINFRFQLENDILNIDQAVIKFNHLNTSYKNKYRFVIFKVDSVILRSNVIYVNSLEANNIVITATLPYESKVNNLKYLEDKYVIAFGKISYQEKSKKFFLRLNNDFQIIDLNKEDTLDHFEGIEFKKYINKASNVDSVSTNNFYIPDSNKNIKTEAQVVNKKQQHGNKEKKAVIISEIELSPSEIDQKIKTKLVPIEKKHKSIKQAPKDRGPILFEIAKKIFKKIF